MSPLARTDAAAGNKAVYRAGLTATEAWRNVPGLWLTLYSSLRWTLDTQPCIIYQESCICRSVEAATAIVNESDVHLHHRRKAGGHLQDATWEPSQHRSISSILVVTEQRFMGKMGAATRILPMHPINRLAHTKLIGTPDMLDTKITPV